jgi:hypothetical protein
MQNVESIHRSMEYGIWGIIIVVDQVSLSKHSRRIQNITIAFTRQKRTRTNELEEIKLSDAVGKFFIFIGIFF